ncbi:hypothetical protein [Flavobacterium sp. 102]|uniref:hypothetical protein n=1 Tax=Flavobacterium sp. 102 TaxID=2135623 RepID=UPI000EAD9082|nr:hypothetical protein [Flavobacterium sp. 102]RKS02846.1 hypothetical protein C8C84_2576 [Flavobacterium sp. 102]
MTPEITIGIISLILGFFLGYLTSYFNEKGKNKAIIEDMKAMTEEKEKVSSHYELDVSKRKYKYEDKRAIYFKYFSLLDEMSTEANIIAQNEVMPSVNKYTQDYLAANGDTGKILKAASELSTSTNNVMLKMHQSQMKLKQETNSIRLIGGEKVLKALTEMENAYDLQLERWGEMMKTLSTHILDKNMEAINAQAEEHKKIGERIVKCKEDIIESMKKELDEI